MEKELKQHLSNLAAAAKNSPMNWADHAKCADAIVALEKFIDENSKKEEPKDETPINP